MSRYFRGKDEAGTAIQQYQDNGTNAQRFSLTRLEYSPQNYNRYKVGGLYIYQCVNFGKPILNCVCAEPMCAAFLLTHR